MQCAFRTAHTSDVRTKKTRQHNMLAGFFIQPLALQQFQLLRP